MYNKQDFSFNIHSIKGVFLRGGRGERWERGWWG
jgi:hypothetical protein